MRAELIERLRGARVNGHGRICICLRIDVNDEDALALKSGERLCQSDGRRRLTDAALQIDDR